MINYKPGNIVDLTFRRKVSKNLLLSYIGEFRSSDRKAMFKLEHPLPDGRELVSFEVWNCQDLETGMKDIKKFPVYHYAEVEDDFLERDRPMVIDDLHEVTSLLDSYQCWLDYCKLENPADAKRDRTNFHINIVTLRHAEQIYKLRELDSDSTLDKNYKVGIRLKLIQKENPNHYTRRDLLIWKQEFPELFTKLQKDVYKTNNNIESNVTE